jgi:triosephosphate isomerase (TIM)
MTAVMCVGETLEDREARETEDKVLGQVRAGLAALGPEAVAGLVVAYEPIWVIGSGRTATPEDAQAVCGAVRSAIATDHGSAIGGGSSDPVRRIDQP